MRYKAGKKHPQFIKVVDGCKLKSGLEVYAYKKLKENMLMFKYEPQTFELIGGFVANTEAYEPDGRADSGLLEKHTNKMQSIKYTPDFVSDNGKWIIETKGRANESFPMRWKLFRKYILEHGLKYTLFKPKNQKQVDQAINIIKQNGW